MGMIIRNRYMLITDFSLYLCNRNKIQKQWN
jgi:hypothetical protein